MDPYSGKVSLTFHSHYDANRQKRELRKRGIACQMAPVPRSLSSSCGSCVLIDKTDFSEEALIDTLEGAWEYKEGIWSALPRQ